MSISYLCSFPNFVLSSTECSSELFQYQNPFLIIRSGTTVRPLPLWDPAIGIIVSPIGSCCAREYTKKRFRQVHSQARKSTTMKARPQRSCSLQACSPLGHQRVRRHASSESVLAPQHLVRGDNRPLLLEHFSASKSPTTIKVAITGEDS
jgi:hypothetical protein